MRGFVRETESTNHCARTPVEAPTPYGRLLGMSTLFSKIIAGEIPGRFVWADEEVVVDGNLISSRNPDDLPAFNRALVAALEGASA
mgnify:CR=1 FL=1